MTSTSPWWTWRSDSPGLSVGQGPIQERRARTLWAQEDCARNVRLCGCHSATAGIGVRLAHLARCGRTKILLIGSSSLAHRKRLDSATRFSRLTVVNSGMLLSRGLWGAMRWAGRKAQRSRQGHRQDAGHKGDRITFHDWILCFDGMSSHRRYLLAGHAAR